MKQKSIACLLVMGCILLSGFLQSGDLPASIKRGQAIYETNCIACHMAKGEGLEGTFPPLAKTGRLSDKARLVKIVFNGLRGPITVNGVEYDMEMNAMTLSDQEATDVLNYIRNSWGNKEAEIKVAEVKKLKESVSGH